MANFEELYDLPVYENLLEELKSICEYDNVCLNYPVGYEDNCQIGVGSMVWDWVLCDNGEKIKTPKPNRLHEKDFTELCAIFKGTSFEKIETLKEINEAKGWWNSLLAVDIDQDGDMDFVAGNMGKNTLLRANVKQPVDVLHGDLDGNGVYDVFPFVLQHKWRTSASARCVMRAR